MKCFEKNLDSPAADLALDELLLDRCDADEEGPVLRFWKSPRCFVVLGYSRPYQRDVHVDACRNAGIPILRRASGGGTVLQGPGCLSYSLVLPIPPTGPLRSITETNAFIMERHRAALQPLVKERLRVDGDTDLTANGLKFSGNAQRRKRNALLFHGTFLLTFDLSLVERFLPVPDRQPAYRANRPHPKFLTNMETSESSVKEALRNAWRAEEGGDSPPSDRLDRLIREKYEADDWIQKF